MVPYLACLAMPMYLVSLLAQRSPLWRSNKPTVVIVMACSESHNWFTSLAQRWRVQVVTITLEDDLLSQHGENLAKHAITKTSDMLFFAGPCTRGSSWARLNITRGPTTSKLIQNKQPEFWKLFKVFSQLKRHAESKKAAMLFELLKSCEYWNDERLKKQIKLGESHEFDGCSYALKQRYAKKPLPIRKPWRVISWNFDLGEPLAKKCNGNHSHGPCAGRETKDTQLYTSLIANVILRRFAARAKCARHHGVNLASPCIFKGFAEKKKKLQGENLLPPHRRLPFVHTAASVLLQDDWNKASVGCTSLPDYLLKRGGRAPHLDQGTLVYWFISAVVLLHIPLSTTLLDRRVVHLQDGG